jgi:hypothetical protein
MERCLGDAYERQREYMRRDLFMGKLNPEKFSQRLQDINKYLDYILHYTVYLIRFNILIMRIEI